MKPSGLAVVPVAVKAATLEARLIFPSMTTQVSVCRTNGLSPVITGAVRRRTMALPGFATRAAS